MKKSLLAMSLLCLAFAPVSLAAPVSKTGGPITKVYTIVASDADYATMSEDFVKVAQRNFNVPAGGALIIATFTAECSLFGSTDPAVNWVEVEIRDGTTKLLPTGGTTPIAFCFGPGYSSHSVQAVASLTAGAHNIKVMAKINKGNADTLSGFLDDWAFTILMSE